MKVLESAILQMIGVLLLCWLCGAGAATGGCSRYGHACWGGHGKRSSHAPRLQALRPQDPPLQDPGQDGDVYVDAPYTVQDAVQEAVQDADDADLDVDTAAPRAFQVGNLDALAGLISIPREQAAQDPDATDDSDELMHRFRLQNRRRHKNKENDVQVLIIPESESPVPDYQIYQILGRASRKRV